MIPVDLTPLRTVAAKLGVRQAQLVKLSEKGAFPAVYRIGSVCRVSELAVGRWLADQAVDAIARRRQAVDDSIRGRRRHAHR